MNPNPETRIVRVEVLRELLRSHRTLLDLALENLKEQGGCDHSVGICYCRDQSVVENASELQTKLQIYEP